MQDINDQEREKVARYARRHGVKQTASAVQVNPVTITKVLAGLGVANGTVALVRHAIASGVLDVVETPAFDWSKA